jgi:hypothetical protein
MPQSRKSGFAELVWVLVTGSDVRVLLETSIREVSVDKEVRQRRVVNEPL